jgi:hypothetical protein
LWVRQLREFNVALLRKWCWRMLMDRGGLWLRVLAARYRVERGRLREGRSGSAWWREIVRICDGIGGMEGSVVWGLCDEKGGGWGGNFLLD